MNEFLSQMVERAKRSPKRVAFPESSCADILRCAEQVVANGMGAPVLVGAQASVEALAAEQGVSTAGFDYFDNTDEANRMALAEKYAEMGFSDYSTKAVARKSKDPVNCGMFLVKCGLADCCAAGKEYPTGDVVFSAMSFIGLAEGVASPSSLGIADIPGFEGPQGSMLGLADCAITAQPDASDLAGIAISSADTVAGLMGWEPRVAMLAFSTKGSAEHETIDVVREAVRRAFACHIQANACKTPSFYKPRCTVNTLCCICHKHNTAVVFFRFIHLHQTLQLNSGQILTFVNNNMCIFLYFMIP